MIFSFQSQKDRIEKMAPFHPIPASGELDRSPSRDELDDCASHLYGPIVTEQKIVDYALPPSKGKSSSEEEKC